MIHWQYYRSGDLFMVKYFFEHAGDALPEHEHGQEESHNVIVVRGSVEIKTPDLTYLGEAGNILEFDWSKPHSVIATTPRTLTLHGYLYGRPKWYDGLPTYGTFPPTATETAADRPSLEGQGPISFPRPDFGYL